MGGSMVTLEPEGWQVTFTFHLWYRWEWDSAGQGEKMAERV